MREQRTPTSLRGAESVPERGAGRSLVCGVGDETSCSRKLRKKIDLHGMRQRFRVLLREEVRQTVADRAEVDERTTPPLWLTRREFRLGSVRLLLLLTNDK